MSEGWVSTRHCPRCGAVELVVGLRKGPTPNIQSAQNLTETRCASCRLILSRDLHNGGQWDNPEWVAAGEQ